MPLNNSSFEKWICSRNDSCKLWLYLDAGIIILHYIKAGIYNSETEGAYLTMSIKQIVVEMSDTPLKQIFSRWGCAMCCIMTPAALASQWKILLMFSITATLPLHQDPSKLFWQVDMWWCTPQVRDIAQVEARPTELPVSLEAMQGKKGNNLHFHSLYFVYSSTIPLWWELATPCSARTSLVECQFLFILQYANSTNPKVNNLSQESSWNCL